MQDLTQGSVRKHLVQTAGFMFVTMVFQTLYLLVDLYWVGRLGKEALAAVGLAGNLQIAVLAISQTLGVGVTTLIALAVGERDRSRALSVFNQAQALSLVVAAAFLLAVMAARTRYVEWLSPDAMTAALAADYLRWFNPALALQVVAVALSSALRGMGNFRSATIVQTSTVILNALLAPVLIFGWGTGHAMGVEGAAASTLVSIVISVIWLSTCFLRSDQFVHFVWHELRPALGLWREMLKIGVPAGTEFVMMAVYMLVVYDVAVPFGSAAQAGVGIGLRVTQALLMPIVALGVAVAPVAGHNLGAKSADRVLSVMRTACAFAVAAAFLATALCRAAPAALIGVFSDDAAVMEVGLEYLHIVSWGFVATSLIFVASSMLQALGNTVPSLVASCVRVSLVVGPTLVLSRLPAFTLRWVWYLSLFAVLVQLGIITTFLRRELRKKLGGFPAPAITAPPAQWARQASAE